jgi:hypothetical protein
MIWSSIGSSLITLLWWLPMYSHESIRKQIGFLTIFVAMIAFILITGTIELVRAKKYGVQLMVID